MLDFSIAHKVYSVKPTTDKSSLDKSDSAEVCQHILSGKHIMFNKFLPKQRTHNLRYVSDVLVYTLHSHMPFNFMQYIVQISNVHATLSS